MNIWIVLIGFILALLSCIMIFFARNIVKKKMNFGEENDAVLGMKISGWVGLILGLILVYFFIR